MENVRENMYKQLIKRKSWLCGKKLAFLPHCSGVSLTEWLIGRLLLSLLVDENLLNGFSRRKMRAAYRICVRVCVFISP